MDSPTTLTTLPTEIILEILSYLVARKPSLLVPVCCTSKRLNAIAQPLLSRRVIYYYTPRADAQSSQANKIAQHFLNHPDRRHAVTHLAIQGRLSESAGLKDPRGLAIALSDHERQGLLQCAEDIFPGAQHLSGWKEELQKGSYDAFFALLIAWATQLEALYWGDCNPESAIISVVRHMSTNICSSPKFSHLPLHNLRDLRVSLRNLPGDLQPEGYELAHFLHLPRLRSLSCDGAHTGVPREAYPFPQRTSSLEELVLDNFGGTNEGLIQFISAARNLRKLYLVATMPSARPDWSLNAVSDHILAHHATLEELFYYLPSYYLPSEVESANTGHRDLGVWLSGFTKLKKLEIHSAVLFNGQQDFHLLNYLPTSLEHLTIHGISEAKIEKLIPRCDDGKRFPHLATINVYITEFPGIGHQPINLGAPDTGHLQHLADQAGVELIVNPRAGSWPGTFEVWAWNLPSSIFIGPNFKWQ
jgi:hypothetical protein